MIIDGFSRGYVETLTKERDELRAQLASVAYRAEYSCFVPPDGGSPTEAECLYAKAVANAIRIVMPESAYLDAEILKAAEAWYEKNKSALDYIGTAEEYFDGSGKIEAVLLEAIRNKQEEK